jgi:alkylation response protein AidB-like acyl-CoA dehydrogenase
VIPYLSEEQMSLRVEVRKFVLARLPIASTRKHMSGEDPFDRQAWRQMSGQLGLVALAVAPDSGGLGPAFVELAIVMEELGYVCAGTPLLSTVLAATALGSVRPATAGDLLERLCAGELTATLCVADDAGSWAVADSAVTATQGDDGQWRLSGHSAFVVDGETADLLVVAGRVADHVALFALDGVAAGVARQSSPTLDQTRRLSRITFDGSPARLIADADADAEFAVRRTLDVATVLLAAEQLGGARACLDMAVQYAKVREQFGRPIGSFQAIKFKCADMLVKVESATSAVFYASRLLGHHDEDDELATVASLAKAYCSDAFFEVAADNIQIHGGIGFTWEHDAHLYFKRATCSRMLFGDPVQHRERMLQSIGI